MRAVIVSLTAFSILIAVMSLVAMHTSGEALSNVAYQPSVVDETLLRQRSIAAAASASALATATPAPAAAAPTGAAATPAAAGASATPPARPAAPFKCAAALDRAFVESVWTDRHELVVSFTNGGGMDFARNLYAHGKASGLDHMAFGAMDGAALEALAALRIPCFPMRDASKSLSEKIGWGSSAFRNLGVRKITLLVDLLELGVNTVLVDADTVLTRNPLPYLRRWPDAHVLASTDHLVNTTDDTGLEALDAGHSHWNVGFFYLRADAVEFARAWRELLIRKPHWWDQHAFGWLLRQGVTGDGKGPGNGGPRGPGWDLKGDKTGLSDPRLFRCFSNGTLVCGTLPVALFANGHVGLVQRLAHKLRLQPYFVHATHQYSATAGKRHRLREARLWIDPPEYYDPPGGLLYVPMPLPDSLLRPTGADGLPLFREQKAFLEAKADHATHPALQAYFALAHHQIAHVRDAAATAWALGRKLVLPPLACGFDRGPFPHVGKSPGAFEQVLPIYPCPLDYMFDIEARRGLGEGAPALLDIAREYSLLNNSRMPRAVLDGALRLQALPSGVPADALRRNWQSAKLVELGRSPPAFGAGSLLSAQQQEEFKKAVKHYTDVWCCVMPVKWGMPGHILHDPLFDQVPHTDRMLRKWDCPWHITIGAAKPRCDAPGAHSTQQSPAVVDARDDAGDIK